MRDTARSRFKRAFDIVGACAGLIVFAPVMAVAATAVLIDDGRPVLFRQQRLGYRRRPFSIIKIRTMRDGRITRVGKVLRATGLDEIPQFINILSGEMSAVGPRPLTEGDVRRLGWTGIAFDFRWEKKPGLTGLAQIVGAPSTDDCAGAGSNIHGPLESVPRLPADRAFVCGQRLRQIARAAATAPVNAGTRRVNWKNVRSVVLRTDGGLASCGLFFACPIGADLDSTTPRRAELCQQSLERAILERRCIRAALCLSLRRNPGDRLAERNPRPRQVEATGPDIHHGRRGHRVRGRDSRADAGPIQNPNAEPWRACGNDAGTCCSVIGL